MKMSWNLSLRRDPSLRRNHRSMLPTLSLLPLPTVSKRTTTLVLIFKTKPVFIAEISSMKSSLLEECSWHFNIFQWAIVWTSSNVDTPTLWMPITVHSYTAQIRAIGECTWCRQKSWTWDCMYPDPKPYVHGGYEAMCEIGLTNSHFLSGYHCPSWNPCGLFGLAKKFASAAWCYCCGISIAIVKFDTFEIYY